MAQPITGRRVVDVGCWTGGLLKLLAPLEPTELMGVDLAGPWLRDAQSAVPSANFVEVTTLSELPATLNHHFDVAMLLETLEHLPRGSEAAEIASLAAVLVPGGRLIVSTPAAGIAAPLDPAWSLAGHRHYRLTTLRKILSSAGIDIERVHYSGNSWTSLDTFLLYFTKHVLHRAHRTHRFVSAHEPSRLYQRRRPTSTNIWLEGRVKSDAVVTS